MLEESPPSNYQKNALSRFKFGKHEREYRRKIIIQSVFVKVLIYFLPTFFHAYFSQYCDHSIFKIQNSIFFYLI